MRDRHGAHRKRRNGSEQLDLFARAESSSPEDTPAWSVLPDRTRRKATELMVRLMLGHDLRYRAAIVTAYGAGLRISETVAVKVGDIKPDKKLLYIPSGKGGSERLAPLPDGVIDYLIKIARLGGYLDRAKDLPPGIIVMWRGLSRLTDIALGATLKIDDVGNWTPDRTDTGAIREWRVMGREARHAPPGNRLNQVTI